MARLPKLEFQSIIAPYVPAPIEEFGSATKVLTDNYNLALDNLSKFQQAQASIESSPLEGDRNFLNSINQQYKQEFDTIKGQEDLENQLSRTKKLATNYASAIQPVVQNKQKYTELVDAINKNQNIGDKGRAINYIKGMAQNTITTDPDTGMVYSNFDPSKFSFLNTPDVNVYDILDRGLHGIEKGAGTLPPTIENLKVKDPETGTEKSVGTMVKQGKWEYLSKDVISTIIKGIIEGNADLKAYAAKEKTLSEFDGDNRYEQGLETVKTALQEKYKIDRTYLDYTIPTSLNKTGSGTSDFDGGVILSGNSSAITLNNPEDFRNISKAKEQLQSTINNPDADPRQKEIAQDKLNDINFTEDRVFNNLKGKNIINDSDIQVLKKYNYMSNMELTSTLSNLSKEYSIGGLNEEKNNIRKDLVRLQSLRNTTNKEIERELTENPPISITFKSYNASDVGKYSTATGAFKELYTDNVLNAGYSVASTGENLQKYLNKNFKNKKIDGLEGKFNYNGKFETRITNGGYYQGNPVTDLIIYGTNEDKEEQVIGTIPITGGEVDNQMMRQVNKNVKNVAIANNDPQLLAYAEQGIMRTTVMVTGETVGELSSRKNIQQIPKGSSRTLINFNNGTTAKVKAFKDGSYRIVRVDKNNNEVSQTEPFYNQDQMEILMSNIFVPK